MLETIEAVRKVSGRNFAVQYGPRRPRDIMTMIADTGLIRSTLDWTPQYDDLETIARHALAWEEKLFRERGGLVPQAEFGVKSGPPQGLIWLEKRRHSRQEVTAAALTRAQNLLAPSMERG